MKIPCEECIAYAACKHKDIVNCEILYMYFCILDDTTTNFKEYEQERLEIVEKKFDKYVRGTQNGLFNVYFTEDKRRAAANQRFVNTHPLSNELG